MGVGGFKLRTEMHYESVGVWREACVQFRCCKLPGVCVSRVLRTQVLELWMHQVPFLRLIMPCTGPRETRTPHETHKTN